MCMSCGCGSPNDKHGDNRNITLDELDQAAQAAGIGVGQAVQNMVNGWQQMSSSPEASGERNQQIADFRQDQSAQQGPTPGEQI